MGVKESFFHGDLNNENSVSPHEAHWHLFSCNYKHCQWPMAWVWKNLFPWIYKHYQWPMACPCERRWAHFAKLTIASVHHTMEVEFFNFYPKKLVWSQNKRHVMATAHKLKNKTKENTTIQGTGSFFLWYPTRAHGCEKKEKRLNLQTLSMANGCERRLAHFTKLTIASVQHTMEVQFLNFHQTKLVWSQD